MQKTLGGERLGSGKKMKVDLHGYERSTHDLGYLWRSPMSAGTLVPFLNEIALPGDTFDINLDCDIKTHPTIGPLFGSYKVQLDIFLCPIRLYHSALHNNALNIGRNMAAVKLPQIRLTAPTFISLDEEEIGDVNSSQINQSCLLAYLGIRGIGWNQDDGPKDRDFMAIPILAYWEIYKNYYANKQEEIGAVIHTPGVATVGTETGVLRVTQGGASSAIAFYPATGVTPINNTDYLRITFVGAQPPPGEVYILIDTLGWIPADELAINWTLVAAGTLEGVYDYQRWGDQILRSWRLPVASDKYGGPPNVVTFDLVNIDTMRTEILQEPPTNQFLINTPALEPYKFLVESPNSKPNILRTQEGLALKTYQSDMLNNWLSTEWIDGPGGISEITAIDTSGGSFNIDTLVLSKKVYNMLNRIAVSGGSYDDWMDAVYAHDRYQRVESPMYMGGLIKELVFQEVVSNSESAGEGATQPLGTLAGKGVMAKKHKGGNIVIKVDEPSIILGIVSLTPRIDYSQGNKWSVHLQTMDDLHKPALDEIGFQELITEQMAWWDTFVNVLSGNWEQKSAGKQPAWLNYMTNVNQCYSNFAVATNEMFMTLNRRYEKDTTGIVDLTTYIDPVKFNFIFANTAIDAQNFWTQIAVDITARRKMSAKIMPNL